MSVSPLPIFAAIRHRTALSPHRHSLPISGNAPDNTQSANGMHCPHSDNKQTTLRTSHSAHVRSFDTWTDASYSSAAIGYYSVALPDRTAYYGIQN